MNFIVHINWSLVSNYSIVRIQTEMNIVFGLVNGQTPVLRNLKCARGTNSVYRFFLFIRIHLLFEYFYYTPFSMLCFIHDPRGHCTSCGTVAVRHGLYPLLYMYIVHTHTFHVQHSIIHSSKCLTHI